MDTTPSTEDAELQPVLEETSRRRLPPFPVVGIGASAGGLQALQRFLVHTPADSGMAFVIVTHLSPEYESHLPGLLQSSTTMPVVQVTDTIPLEPNHVYVIPPNRNLSTIDTHLALSPLEASRRERAPIDHFFRTLADTHETRAYCVILSGTGSDGSLGLRRIKETGGLTMVQEPSEAEFNAMPQSAIATGDVEFVLPVDQIPAKLVEYVGNTTNVPLTKDGQELPGDALELLEPILTHVRAYNGHDFSRYKSSTITRRLQRRMQIHGIELLSDYLGYLREHVDEVQALFNDFLITVTNFFRDAESFAILERHIIPALFTGKGLDDQVRVWVTGCATGEEAYSIAILLLEHTAHLDRPPSIQVFATDLNNEALHRAREGFYAEQIAMDVTAERLERFFTRERGGYRVRQELREVVLFAPQSLLKDPPFSRLDLISCRNVLIYMQRSVQRQLYELFHYALRPNGYLFLGSAESIESKEFFREIDQRHNIFQGQLTGGRESRLPVLPLVVSHPHATAEPAVGAGHKALSYELLHARQMEQFTPHSLLVNENYEIVYFSGGTDRYLWQPRGEPTNHVLQRVRDELRIDLTTALYRAFEKGESSQMGPISLVIDGVKRSVAMSVRPADIPELKGLVLVLFHEHDEQARSAQIVQPSNDLGATIRSLEEELASTRKRLQTTVEEYEISKEEMKAANEELQSMNEELRSTAEELETSKEELQSINEELLTVNQENKNKIEELSNLTNDLQNLLSSTDIATLFLDRDLRIMRFTTGVRQLFNIIATDHGRPLAHLTHKLDDNTLVDNAATVLKTLVPIEREISGADGAWYLVRVLSYRTSDDRIDGVVITFVDISQRKLAEQERERLVAELDEERTRLKAASEMLEQLVAKRTKDVRKLASDLLVEGQEVQQRIAQVLQNDLQPHLLEANQRLHTLHEQLAGKALEEQAVLAAQVLDVLDYTNNATQQLAIHLTPPELHLQDFVDVLQGLRDYMRQAHGLEVKLTMDGAPLLTRDMRILLYQSIRALLSNVAQHAGVAQASLDMAYTPDEIRVEIRDEGRGFNVAKTLKRQATQGSDGYNLSELGERLRFLGGQLLIISTEDQGVTIVLRLPLAQQP